MGKGGLEWFVTNGILANGSELKNMVALADKVDLSSGNSVYHLNVFWNGLNRPAQESWCDSTIQMLLCICGSGGCEELSFRRRLSKRRLSGFWAWRIETLLIEYSIAKN